MPRKLSHMTEFFSKTRISSEVEISTAIVNSEQMTASIVAPPNTGYYQI